MANAVSLLNSPNRIEAPYISVIIGTYEFGVYTSSRTQKKDDKGFYQQITTKYPNYVKSLNITKLNGQFNSYVLNLTYPITPTDDPNFFEKVFSSVSDTRKIVFKYGDASLPAFVYKEEEAIITSVNSTFNIQSSVISYTVNAVSSAVVLQSGSYTFLTPDPVKPSDEIKKLLNNKIYGLRDIFYGMNNQGLVDQAGLIPGDDKVVKINSKTNISPLDYLQYLVSCMVPSSADISSIKQKSFYILTVIDDKTGEFGGPYFKIVKTDSAIDKSDAYEINIGYSTADIVTSFSINNNENYSIYYDWQNEVNDNRYTYRINDDGQYELEFAPVLSSKNDDYKTNINDQTWWSKLTEFPISAQITIKGLIRPAILMTYTRLNIWFFGTKHINSGLYIVTKQVDSIDERGYRTQLSLVRVGKDV